MKKYSIDSLGYFPCESCREFMDLRKANLKCTIIFWFASGIDLSDAEYWIKKSPIILFLN